MKEYLRDLLSNAGAEYTEIRLERSINTRITFTGPDLEDCSQNVNFGGNVRALYKGAWGFTTFNSIEELESKVKMAVNHAKSIGDRRNDPFRLADVPPVEIEMGLDVRKDPSTIPLSKKLEVMGTYNRIVLDYDKRISTSSVRYFDKNKKLTYANSEGTYLNRESIDLGMAVAAIVRTADGAHMYAESTGSSNDFDMVLGMEEKAKEAAKAVIAISQAESVKGGKYTVILDPALAGVFVHEAFGHLSEGDNVYEDPNLQKVMVLGRDFGGKNLNVCDTGLESGARGFLPYDDEGVKTERTYLIRDGKLVGRLHSRETAAKMGEKATGNCRAINFEHPPIPRMRTTIIEPGNVSFADMIANTKEGLYCIRARGGETNGELFTFTALDAFMIRNGKLEERVRDVTLSGNVFETLKNIDMIGNDYRVDDGPGGCGKAGQFPLPTSEGSPHIRIQNVIVGGK